MGYRCRPFEEQDEQIGVISPLHSLTGPPRPDFSMSVMA